MKEITFATGNLGKAKYAAKLLGVPVVHKKMDLPEVQSLDLREIVECKLLAAFDAIKKPVIVEDVALEFEEMGKLPGTFIGFFVDKMPLENICKLIRKNRRATARCIIGFTDGKDVKFFEGYINGKIAKKPKGTNGFGWDRIFIADGFSGKTNAELCEDDYGKVTMTIKRFDLLKSDNLSLERAQHRGRLDDGYIRRRLWEYDDVTLPAVRHICMDKNIKTHNISIHPTSSEKMVLDNACGFWQKNLDFNCNRSFVILTGRSRG